MANIKSAKKRAVQAEKHRLHNNSQRSQMRTAVKNVLKLIETGNKAGAETAFKTAESLLDRFAGRGQIHKNKASRHKSRITARIRAMA
ncbi:MAG: 30S ribosomal protein S20 [Xanthomonadales bacterium]|nr:30S ribosomal protein S20 [Xanthomonadales bacterium]